MTTRAWKVDETHSGIHFAVRHMVISKVRGLFDRWTAELKLDEQDLTRSSVEVTIETASIDTRSEQRDGHLRSPDFFDAERFPAIRFRSKRIDRVGDGEYRVTGDLTIRDVTREVALETEFLGFGKDPWGGQRAGFSAKTSIDRREFGLTWNAALETGGVLVSDKVEIGLEIEAVAQEAARTEKAA